MKGMLKIETNLFTQCRHKNYFQNSFRKTLPSIISKTQTTYVKHCINNSGRLITGVIYISMKITSLVPWILKWRFIP